MSRFPPRAFAVEQAFASDKFSQERSRQAILHNLGLQVEAHARDAAVVEAGSTVPEDGPRAYRLGPSRGQGAGPLSADQMLQRADAALRSQANGTGAEYAEGAREDLAQIAPFVRSGVIGAEEVQAMVKSATLGGITDQRNQRKAQREMRAIITQTENGTFNETQMAGAMQSLKREYGESTLLTVPGYADLVGKGGELEAAKASAKTAFAKKYTKGNENYVRWDDEASAPDFDAKAIAFDRQIAEAEAEKSRPVREYAASRFKALAPSKPRETDFKDSFGRVDRAAYDRAIREYQAFVDQNLPASFGGRVSPSDVADVNASLPIGAPAAAAPAPVAAPKKFAFQNTDPISEAEAVALVKADPTKAGFYQVVRDGRVVGVEITP